MARGDREYRIYTETDGYGTTYSEWYTKSEAVKTARALAREYPESSFEVYHEYSERPVWKSKKRNPPKNRWINARAVKFNRNGSVSIRKR